MSLTDFGALLLLAALWGSSFLFIRVAAPALGPLALCDARVLIAGVCLLAVAFVRGEKHPLRDRWRQYMVLGALNAALPFTLIATAELRLTASLAAILNATTPLWGAVIASVWLREPLTTTRITGLLLGLCGVAMVVGWSPLPLNAVTLLAVGASLLAALSYGGVAVYTRVTFRGASPLSLGIGQQLAAGAWLILPAVATLPKTPPEPTVVLYVVLLAVLGTSISSLIYFRLIERVGPTKAMSVTFLVPVFGILWGALFLHEPLRFGQLAGFLVILCSLGLVVGRPGAESPGPAPDV